MICSLYYYFNYRINDNVGYRLFKILKLVFIIKEILKWLLIYIEKIVDGFRYCLDEMYGFKCDFFMWNV